MAPPPPRTTDIAALEARIAALEEKVEKSRKTQTWTRYKIVDVLKHLGMYTEKSQ